MVRLPDRFTQRTVCECSGVDVQFTNRSTIHVVPEAQYTGFVIGDSLEQRADVPRFVAIATRPGCLEVYVVTSGVAICMVVLRTSVEGTS